LVQAVAVDANPFLLFACLMTGAPFTLRELVVPTVDNWYIETDEALSMLTIESWQFQESRQP